MKLEQFTIKSQEAIGAAFEIARAHGQQAVEPLHLLLAVSYTHLTLPTTPYV